MHLRDGVTVKLTFTVTLNNSKTVTPIVYLTIDEDVAPTASKSEVRGTVAGSNTIYLTPRGLGSNEDTTGCVSFYTVGDADYTVDQFVLTHVSYIPAGWYVEDQELKAPTADQFAVYDGDTDLSNNASDHDDHIQLYQVGVNEGTTPAGQFPGLDDQDNAAEWRFFRLGMSYMYYDGQESKIREDTTNCNIASMDAHLDLNVQSCYYGDSLDESTYIDRRISGARIYVISHGETTSTLISPENPLLLAEVDNVKGARWWNGDWSPWTDDTTNNHIAEVHLNNLTEIPFVDYKTLNAYSSTVDSINLKYKTAVVTNNRCYAGNVKHLVVDDQSGVSVERHFGDRIVISPSRAYDTFPSDATRNLDNVMEVDPGDGDSIIKLLSFSGRLIVFKKKNVYIVNITDNVNTLESTESSIGIGRECCATHTPYGPAWVNDSGVYFYDGETVANLINQKLDKIEWNRNIDKNECAIGYITHMQQLVVFSSTKGTNYNIEDAGWSNVIFIYDFATQSWTKGVDAVSFLPKSNMVTNSEGDLIYISGNSPGGENVAIANVGESEIAAGVGSILLTTSSLGANNYLHMYMAGVGWRRVSGSLPEMQWDHSGFAGTDFYNRYQYMTAFKNAIDTVNVNDADTWNISANLSSAYNAPSGTYGLTIDILTWPYGGTAQTVDGVSTAFAISTVAGFDDSPDGEGGAPYGSHSSGSGAGTAFTSVAPTTPTADNQTTRVHIERNGSTANDVQFCISIDVYPFPDPFTGCSTYAGNATAYYTTSGGGDDNDAVAAGLDAALDALTINDAPFIVSEWITVTNSSGYVQLVGKNSCSFSVNSYLISTSGAHFSMFDNDPKLAGDNVMAIQPQISTKDYDFGSPGVNKKVYKVYLTYKFLVDKGIAPRYSINGDSSTTYAFDVTSLDASTVWNTVELKPASSSVTTNIYSFQIHFAHDGSTIPKGFEINDITIIFRKKNVK